MATAKKKKAKKAKKAAPKRAAKARVVKAKARKAKAVRKPAARARKSTAANGMRALAQRIIDVTIANDDEATLALYADDVESKEMGQPPSHGLDAVKAKFAGWRNFTSAAVFEPRRVCVDGNTIVIEWLGRVTLAASGKTAELHEIAVHEIRGGKIVREAFFYNPGALS